MEIGLEVVIPIGEVPATTVVFGEIYLLTNFTMYEGVTIGYASFTYQVA